MFFIVNSSYQELIKHYIYYYVKNKIIFFIITRILDIFFSVLGLIILSPLFLIISILIKFDSKGSVFYYQKRVGKNFKEFFIIKFRTMIQNADKYDNLITAEDDTRITRLGKFLRKYKLDELPQLINVLKNDMSLVGPRPEVPEYVYANKDYKKLLLVKPGITDYASIKYINESELLLKAKLNGKNLSEYYEKEILPDKIKISHEYLENLSIINNFRIILFTLFRMNQDLLLIKKREFNKILFYG